MLQDFIPQLNKILDYSDEIDRGQQLVDLQKVIDDLDKVKQIEYNTQTNVSKVLESDVSFDSGQYELSDKGKRFLEEWNENIIRNKEEFKKLYPDR